MILICLDGLMQFLSNFLIFFKPEYTDVSGVGATCEWSV